MFLQQLKVLVAIDLVISSCFSLPLSEFYPYGTSKGDTALPPNDDGSSGEISISILFPYFDHNHDSLFVSTVLCLFRNLFPLSKLPEALPCVITSESVDMLIVKA